MSLQDAATRVVKRLVDAGYTAYFAGGWVRDFLINRTSDDIDIATNAPLNVVISLFPKTIALGAAFGIVVVVEEGHPFEVATFRKDKDYVDGRRPERIETATAEEDAERRDFTINGMFYDPIQNQLHDFVGGQKDLRLGIVRAIGDPSRRFEEDRLRMMRAARYATRFDFTIEKETLQAIQRHAHTLLPAVAIERIWQEFKKIAQYGVLAEGLVLLQKLGLLPTIFPSLQSISTEEVQRRTSKIPFFPTNTPLLLAILELFPEYGEKEAVALAETFKLSNQDRKLIPFYYHAKQMLLMTESLQEKLENIEWAKFYAHPMHALCIDIFLTYFPEEKRRMLKTMHTARIHFLRQDIERIVLKRPLVTADILMREGIPSGPKLGLLLQEAERIAVNQHLDSPQQVLGILKASVVW